MSFSILLFLVFVLFSSGSGILVFANSTQDLDNLLKEGNILLQLGKFNDAISYFDQVLEIEQNNVEALAKKGDALAELGKLEEAASYYDKVIRIKPYLNDTSGTYYLSKLLEIDPNNVQVLYQKRSQLNEGNILLQLGKFNDAISYFDQVLEIEQNNVEALAKKGDALAELGKLDEAASYYDKVIRIKPYLNDTSGAFYLSKLLKIDPNHVQALYKRGTSLSFFTNQIEKAISFFDRALEIEPDRPDILASKGYALVNSNKTEEAIPFFDNALKFDPNFVFALNGKGDALTKLEKFEEAFSYFDKSLAIEPDNPDTLFKKGDAYRAMRNYDLAFSYFYKVLQMDPNNFLAMNKIKIAHSYLNFTDFDGFIETIIRDKHGNLVAHLKINEVQILNHDLAKNMINDWNLTKKIKRDGTDFQVFQHERIVDETHRTYHGGSTYYGTYLSQNTREVSLIRADYWFYQVDEGDQTSIVITAFQPVN